MVSENNKKLLVIAENTILLSVLRWKKVLEKREPNETPPMLDTGNFFPKQPNIIRLMAENHKIEFERQ